MTERRITISLEHHLYILFPCIYRIRVGRLFYIGRTKNIQNRMAQHTRHINWLLANYARLSNLGGKDHEMSTFRRYGRIARHLLDNPRIQVLEAELLEYYADLEQLSIRENALLRLYKGHKDCTNSVYSAPIDFTKKVKHMV